MANPLALLNSAPRQGVTVYSPTRPLPAAATGRQTPQRPATARDVASATALATHAVGKIAPSIPGANNDPLFNAITGSPEAQAQRQQVAQQAATKKAQADEPFWKKSLGYILAPLAPLSVPLKVVEATMEEAVKALPDSWEKKMYQPFGTGNAEWQKVGNMVAPLLGGVLGMDPAKTHKSGSFLSRIAPSSAFGAGQIYGNDIPIPGLTGLRNLGIDVLHDPLTFLTPAGGTVADLSAEGAEAASKASAARTALADAPEMVNGAANPAIKDLQDALEQAEQQSQRVAKESGKIKDLPHNRQGRMGMISELAASGPEGEATVAKHATEISKGIDRGFSSMSQEAKDALGITKSGLRVRGTNVVLPFTSKLAEGANLPGQLLREGLGQTGEKLMSTDSKFLQKLGEGRTPVNLGDQYRVMRSESASAADKVKALGQIFAENNAHMTQNIVEGRAGTEGSIGSRVIRKLSKAEQVAMTHASEADAAPTALKDTVQKIAKVFADSTGRGINEVAVRDTATHVPHIWTPEWLDFRQTLNPEAQEDLKRLTGLTTRDTLKSSGHLDKARVLELGADGAPKSFKIGDRMVTLERNGIEGLNEAFAKAFPEFKGKVYEEDPLKIIGGYIKSVGQSSRKWSLNTLPEGRLAQSVTGPLADELAAKNEALRLQSPEARIAEVSDQARTAGQRAPEVGAPPIVPGSLRDQANRAFHEQLPQLEAIAHTPDQQAQLAEMAANIPKPVLDQPDSGIFRAVESPKATQALADKLLSPEAVSNEAALRSEGMATTEASQKTLGGVQKELFRDVRSDAKTTESKLAAIDNQIKSYKTQLEGFRSVRSNNPDQIAQMIEATSRDATDLEAELAKKQATWKGLGTKAANKAERQLRDQLEQLKAIRDEATQHLSEATSTRIADEVTKRTEMLHAPLKAAEERLTAKTASIPAPFKQSVLDSAHDVLDKAGVTDQHWQAYDQAIAARPTNTPLTTGRMIEVGDQRALDLAAHRSVGGEVTPYIEAQGRAKALENMIPDATGPQARRMKADLAEINKEFAPGGKYYAERKARGIMAQQLEHEQAVKQATVRERDTLERARGMLGTRQEAIVRDAQGNRVLSDSAGFEPGGTRKITPIQNTPQPAASADVYGNRAEARLLPPQRTEAQAISDVQAQLNPGSPAHAAEVDRTTQAVADFEQNMPTMTGEARAAALRDIGSSADKVLGPISTEMETMKNLNTDLGNKAELLARRQNNAQMLDRLAKAQIDKGDLPGELINKARQLQKVIRQNPNLDDLSLASTESLLHNEIEQLTLAGEKVNHAVVLAAAQKAARDGTLPKVMVAGLHDGWVTIHGGLVQAGDKLIDQQLYDSFMKVGEAVNDPKLFGRTFNNLTNLWKTYATLSPGFHVRNALGGIFMNLSDGVGFDHQLEAIQIFKGLRSGGEDWAREQEPRVQAALAAMHASGAGGQFDEAGVRSGLGNLSLTRASRKAGEWVEGPLRLAMALDSVDRGDSLMSAYERINRVHFDYSNVSKMDETMKRIVPFWTFMSRNLPLQTTQMWSKPAAYAFYGSVKRNFQAPDDPLTPDYWSTLGAWNTGKTFRGMPLYLDPDFGFNRVMSDVSNVTDAFAGGNPGALLSNVNPLISAPLDFLMKRDSFTDRSFKDTDFSEPKGIAGHAASVLAHLVPGQTNEAGQVSDNFTNMISSLIPLYDRSIRLTGSSDPQRIPESWARFFGAPVRTLSDKQKTSTALGRYLDAQAEQRRISTMNRKAG